MNTLRIALAQMNSTVGDLEGNLRKIGAMINDGRKQDVDLIAFPEMAITGYPPEDLLLKPQFIKNTRQVLDSVVAMSQDMCLVVGFIDKDRALYNAAAIIHAGQLAAIYHKWRLPNYGVFDENRYFSPGNHPNAFEWRGVTMGVNICEDIWSPEGPTPAQADGGAEMIININASPYHIQKGRQREKMLSHRAKENGVRIVYVNMVGGQDELVFDGGSLVYDHKGRLLARAPQFEESLMVLDLPLPPSPAIKATKKGLTKSESASNLDIKKVMSGRTLGEKKARIPGPGVARALREDEEIYRALTLGVSDYATKNGFKKALIALSGGIDSALTACIAVDALGKENVIGVFMPSRYTAQESKEDAEGLARNLGIKLKVLSIEGPFQASLDLLSETFQGLPADITEENIQSRIRGNIMMALSNKFGWLVLTTGNKSEASVGYATLYGDMAGGFAVIKDLWKSRVYRLARMRNAKTRASIPARILRRPPTAELRPNQKDQDTLPPYATLDPILKAYVEEDKGFREIVSMGFDKKLVAKIISLVDRSEFKRRQAPLGIKITARALGKDRRMPITNRYRSTYQLEAEDKKPTTVKKRRKKIA